MRYQYRTVAALIFSLDFLTKWAMRTKLGPLTPIEIIPGFLSLSYSENPGIAFGLFSETVSAWKPWVLAALAIVAVIAVAAYGARVSADRRLLQTSLACLMGGILGNFADRIVRGHVVDFIDFHIHDTFHWPTFNVADSAITIGIALLLIDTIKNPEEKDGDMRDSSSEQP